MSATDPKLEEHWTVSHPETLKEVMQTYGDADLENHLRAVKKSFADAVIVEMRVNPSPDKKSKKVRKAKEPVQVGLF